MCAHSCCQHHPCFVDAISKPMRLTPPAPHPCAGNTCLLVAYHNDKVQPGQCRSTVGKLADFLKESGI